MPVQFDAIQKLKDTVSELSGIISTARDSDQAIVVDLSGKLTQAQSDVAADEKQIGLISQVSAVLEQLEPDAVPQPEVQPTPESDVV